MALIQIAADISGSQVMLAYSSQIYENAGFSSNLSIYLTFGILVLNVFSNLLSTKLVNKFSKKKLLTRGFSIMGIGWLCK